VLSAADRIALATDGGARAMRLDVGTLAPGKPADLAAFAVADARACDTGPEEYLAAHCASRLPR